MRLVFGLVLILGMALAGFAVFMAKDYINSTQTELARERQQRAKIVPTVQVLVAKRPLRYGERLAPEDVRAVKWPESAIPEGTFTDQAVLFPNDNADPRSVLRSMEVGEAIMAVKVTAPGQAAGVSSRLARGMRAFAIQVDVTSGVAGFLRVGDRVDVYWTGQGIAADGSRTGDTTKLILTSIKLIAINQSADEDRTGPVIAKTVTVEVTPQNVANLAQAQATGRLTLALVGAEDDSEIAGVSANRQSVLGVETQTVVEAAKPEVCTIKTRKGAEIIETQVDCPN